MTSTINPKWTQTFKGSTKGWVDLVHKLPYGGIESYLFLHETIMDFVFNKYSTATDKHDKTFIKFIRDPIAAFDIEYVRRWLKCGYLNPLNALRESFKKIKFLMTAFGVNSDGRLCTFQAIYLNKDGKTKDTWNAKDDTHGKPLDQPIDAICGLFLHLVPRCLKLEWIIMNSKEKEVKERLVVDLQFTEDQIHLLLNWLSIERLAMRPSGLVPGGCIRFIPIAKPKEENNDDDDDDVSIIPRPPPPTRAPSPLLLPAPPAKVEVKTKSTIAQNVVTTASTIHNALLEAAVARETSEQQPPESPNSNKCTVPHCWRFVTHGDTCNRCFEHCECFCKNEFCKKLKDGDNDPCRCAQLGGQSNDDLLMPQPKEDDDDEEEKHAAQDVNKEEKVICDECKAYPCICDDPKAEHITHKEAEKELPKCPEPCGDPTECETCGQCSEHCCVFDKKSKCGGQTATDHPCKMRAVCHQCGACRKHVDPTCTGCDRK